MRRPSAWNFSSRSPTSTVTGIVSSGSLSHSGCIAPVPMPRITAASASPSIAALILAGQGANPGGLIREQRLAAPALDERVERYARELLGEALLGGAARGALGWILDPGVRGHEHEPLHAPRRGERHVQRNPSAHRVAAQREALGCASSTWATQPANVIGRSQDASRPCPGRSSASGR